MNGSPLAWARHLPAELVREMLAGITEAADGAHHADDAETLAALDAVLATWRSTALAYADRESYTGLTTQPCPTCTGTGGDHQIGCQP